MVSCPCSNCWSKLPCLHAFYSDEELPKIMKIKAQVAVPSQSYSDMKFWPIWNRAKKPILIRGVSSGSRRPRAIGSGTQETPFSDWGDDYDGFENIRLSYNCRGLSGMSYNSRGCTDDWGCSSEDIRTSTIYNITSKMNLLPGTVLAVQLTKGDPIFWSIHLETTMNQLVDSCLSAKSGGVKLPVSFTVSEKERPKLMKEKQMAMSIREYLDGNIDVTTQGLLISVGPVNTKLCYKIIVVDRRQTDKMYQKLKKQAAVSCTQKVD